MRNYKFIFSLLILSMVVVMSCRDESLYPLPYADKEFAGYLRIIHIRSNILDANNLAASAFEYTLEAVDEKNGDNLDEIEIYVSHRRGTGLTDEVLLTTVSGSVFSAVPQPTISIFKRATITLTATQIQAALATLNTDPDGACATCSPVGGLVAYPGGALLANDQVIVRWIMKLKDGKKFSVLNPQAAVNPAFAKTAEANTTPNITGGQFYSSPFIYTVFVRTLPAVSWVGTYSLTQTSIWSPNHTWNQHAEYPASLNNVLFPNQTVTLATVPGGLSTERQFTVNYRGQNVTMRINMENGTVYVPLQNTGINCATNKALFWTWPPAGNFTVGSIGAVLQAGLPQATTANRGTYTAASDGLTVGNTFTIGLDDDADEYGLRNGYCTWTRRVRLTLVKL